MSEYFKKQKQISTVRNDLDGYLSIEKEMNTIADNGYLHDSDGINGNYDKKLTELERSIQIQYETLEKNLGEMGYRGHPIELIELYVEDKLKAIKLLEAA